MIRQVMAVFLGLVILLGLAGCTVGGEHAFKDSRPEFMQEVRAALTEANIPFREDEGGFIRYQDSHETVVKQIRERVDREMSGGVAIRYQDKVSSRYLKSLLASLGVRYRAENRQDGEWIRWYPQNEAQQKEIEMKVVQHHFDSQRKKSKSKCKEGKSSSGNKDAVQEHAC